MTKSSKFANKAGRQRIASTDYSGEGGKHGSNSQFKRFSEPGSTTTINSQGSQEAQNSLLQKRAQESLQGLRAAVKRAERELSRRPDHVFIQQELEQAKQKLAQAEAIANGGSPEK